MSKSLVIKRTNSNDPDFHLLVSQLDNELWNELKEDQATYDQYNKVPDIQTVLIIYINDQPAACGCFKKYDVSTAEIKRMFVEKQHRGKGISKLVLEELESWAAESGFQYAILETSIHFKTARNLYTNAGYSIIENYGQYKGLDESVCMKKILNQATKPSESKNLPGIEYFLFEEDFIEKNIRCIPMMVRFKMDKAGIKLTLADWSKFTVDERIELANRICGDDSETKEYHLYLAGLVKKYTGKQPTPLIVDTNPAWADENVVPGILIDKLKTLGWELSLAQWKKQTILQRFALLKLCKEGHESKNLSKALKEFGLVNE